MVSNTQIDSLASQQFKDDLKKLVDYLYWDERNHYIGCPSRYHIYVVIRRLAKYISYRP